MCWCVGVFGVLVCLVCWCVGVFGVLVCWCVWCVGVLTYCFVNQCYEILGELLDGRNLEDFTVVIRRRFIASVQCAR